MWNAVVLICCGVQLGLAFQARQPAKNGVVHKNWSGSVHETHDGVAHKSWTEKTTHFDWRKPADSGIRPGTERESIFVDHGPSMYVAILSKRSAFGRRDNVREMWQDGAKGWSSKGWGKLKYQFVVGTASGTEENKRVQEQLEAESKQFGDVLIVESHEGYLDGLLTAKVFASMKSYLHTPKTPDLFMKIDDDTFVEFSRLRGVIRKYISNGGDIKKAFMGVYMRNNETLAPHRGKPCRDPSSIWYEPKRKFKEEYYPVAPQGGPGYILHQSMVSHIVNNGIAASNLLNMEDKAMGVWVHEAIKAGIDVEYVDVPGTNGYALLDRWIRGPMYQYPFVLHHHLDGKTIACLHRIAERKSLTAKVDKCNFNKAESPGDNAVCDDGRLEQPHEVNIEGWDRMKWELDEFGDQVPIAGSTRIFSTRKRRDRGHHFDDDDLARVKGVKVKPIV